MLVLSRKQQEQIRIGDEVTVTILRIKGNTVRVGIEAPRNVRVVRTELPPLENDEPHADEPEASRSTLPLVSHHEIKGSTPSNKAQSSASPATEPATEARRELILAIRQHLAGAVC